MAWLRYLGYLPQLVGLVMVAVDAVEAFKKGALGPEKKSAVLDALRQTWGMLQKEFKVKESFDLFLPILNVLIDLVVAVMNITGYFTHGDKK